VYVLQWFPGVFASVSYACFKCFICLQTYVVNVTSRCFKSRLSCCIPLSPSTASSQCRLLLPAQAGHPNQRRMWSPPTPLFSMLMTFEPRGPRGARKKECKHGCPSVSTPVTLWVKETQTIIASYIRGS
jgi:hypothetical protein